MVLNLLFQSLSLSILLVVVGVSWYFDKTLLTQLFNKSFSETHVIVLAMVVAALFSAGRIMAYGWLGQPQKLGWLKRSNYAIGALVLCTLSFFATFTIISTSLNNTNVDVLVKDEKVLINNHYDSLKTELRQRERISVRSIREGFKQQRASIEESFQPRFSNWQKLMKAEEKRKINAGPNKGSFVGQRYRNYQQQLIRVQKELQQQQVGASIAEHEAKQVAAKTFKEEQENLLKQRSKAIRAVTPEQFEDTPASRNHFLNSALKMTNHMGLPLTYATLLLMISVLISLTIEILTFAACNSYTSLRFQLKPTV